MKEIIFYSVLAVSAIFIFGYSVHMVIGGLVSSETELLIIAMTCSVATIVILFLAWDVVRRRKGS